jgi:hypothetical protein
MALSTTTSTSVQTRDDVVPALENGDRLARTEF